MPKPTEAPGQRSVICHRAGGESNRSDRDIVVVEEPLELRVGGIAVATLMRTPGSDRRLAIGFYLTDGWIEDASDVGALAHCGRSEPGTSRSGDPDRSEENVVDLIRAPGARGRSPTGRSPPQPVSASCGVCGKRTIDEVLSLTPLSRHAMPATPGSAPPEPTCAPLFRREDILRMPDALRRGQRIFDATGSIHAAGIFDGAGRLLAIEEDVGRHNAVDKVIGWALLENQVPLRAQALQVSGRVSFEIVQKAFRAGIPFIAAVSGVSSLAIELADRAGITLVGFVRGSSFAVYTHHGRVEG